MPKEFDACVKAKGRVRTIKPNKKSYIHVCYKDGKSYTGEVRHLKKFTESEYTFTKQQAVILKTLRENGMLEFAKYVTEDVANNILRNYSKWLGEAKVLNVTPGSVAKDLAREAAPGLIALGLLASFLVYYFTRQKKLAWVMTPVPEDKQESLEQYLNKKTLTMFDLKQINDILAMDPAPAEFYTFRLNFFNKGWYSDYISFISRLNSITKINIPKHGLIKSSDMSKLYRMMKTKEVKSEFCSYVTQTSGRQYGTSSDYSHTSYSNQYEEEYCESEYEKLLSVVQYAMAHNQDVFIGFASDLTYI